MSAGKPQNTVLHSIMKKTRNRLHYQIRKCKRVEKFIKNKKLVENCLEGENDIFAEIKRQRGKETEESVTIDGADGANIPNKFADVYEELYNRENDRNNLEEILNNINNNIGNEANIEIEKINPALIKEALKKIKSNKSDPLYDFSSDFLKSAPDILYDHLATIIRSFLVHGHVSNFLLLATMVPIVKDKLSDLNSSSNYRSIAISSLILKLLDWIIILNYGHLLRLDELQFGFQKNNSTSLCSWMVYETIDIYIRNGNIVYGALMDCTKAFDTVQHSKLFKKMLDANVPPVVIRLLLNIYTMQSADVRWKGQFSREFKISNGVRQGAVLSPILFCFYMNDLFDLLRRSRSGCQIGDLYAGVFGYADDLLLISPSRSGLQDMLSIAEKYASEHRIGFSTHINPDKSKTKCIVFSNKELKWSPAPVILNGNPLPWVKSGKYLGCKLTNIQDGYSQDAKIKRAQYIEKNCELIQEFGFAHPEVKTKINRIYNTSFPGSILWDLTSRNVRMLENSWSVSVRHMWELPNNSHRYFIEPLGGIHVKNMLYSRYVTFLNSAKKSSKLTVLLLLQKVKNNLLTVTGRNIRHILTDLGKDDIFKVSKSFIKKKLKFSPIHPDDQWKLQFVREITNVKQNVLTIEENENGHFSNEELGDILDYITTV